MVDRSHFTIATSPWKVLTVLYKKETIPFDEKWYSNKLKQAGLRCDVGISIYGGEIVLVNGPVIYRSYTDLNICKTDLLRHLEISEGVVAD